MRVGNDENLKANDRYDLLLFEFPDGYPRSRIEFGVGDTPRKISGVQKVVQTFVRCLMQTPGSDPIYPTRGTDFQNFTMHSNIQTSPVAAKAAITSAIKLAADQARGFLNSYSFSLESQLDVVEVVTVEQYNQATYVKMRVITKAGTEAPIALPFSSNGLVINEVRNG